MNLNPTTEEKEAFLRVIQSLTEELAQQCKARFDTGAMGKLNKHGAGDKWNITPILHNGTINEDLHIRLDSVIQDFNESYENIQVHKGTFSVMEPGADLAQHIDGHVLIDGIDGFIIHLPLYGTEGFEFLIGRPDAKLYSFNIKVGEFTGFPNNAFHGVLHSGPEPRGNLIFTVDESWADVVEKYLVTTKLIEKGVNPTEFMASKAEIAEKNAIVAKLNAEKG